MLSCAVLCCAVLRCDARAAMRCAELKVALKCAGVTQDLLCCYVLHCILSRHGILPIAVLLSWKGSEH